MNRLLICSLFMLSQTILFAGQSASKSDQFPPPVTQVPGSEEVKKESPEEVLGSFTRGDQTDIFAIPVDDDQFEQDEEIRYFEEESKKNKEASKK